MERGPVREWIETPALCAALLLAAAGLATLGSGSVERTALTALTVCVIAMGFYAFSGISGVVSFGQLSFSAIGGYVAALTLTPVDDKETLLKNAPRWLVELDLPTPVGIVAAGLIAAIVAAILAVPLMRLSGLTAGLASLAVLFMTETVVRSWGDITRGTRGIAGVPGTSMPAVLAWTLGSLVAVWAYRRSRWGLRLAASADDENAARAVGIFVSKERGVAFVLSAFVCGIGGALYVQVLGSVIPGLFFIDLTFVVVAMAVLGGIRSLSGVVIGVITLAVLQELLRDAEAGSVLGVDVPQRPGLAATGIALVLIVVLWRRPDGITRGRELALPRRPRSTPAREPADTTPVPAAD